MLDTERRDASIVDGRAYYPRARKDALKRREEAGCLCQEHEARALQPPRHLGERMGVGRGRLVDARMRHHRQELVQARPGDCPARPSLGELRNYGVRLGVPGRVGAVRVDEILV